MDSKTILIVDDTETNIDILIELLSDEYDVLVALDAVSALNIVEEEEIDLILLDIMMPITDGYEVCKILKANEDTKDIPVIFITAKTDEDSIEKAYEVGGIDYVSKPFKARELLMRVKTQLRLRRLVQNLEHLASYDAMTNIYNRRKLFELGRKKFNDSKDGLCAVMIDIDRFKEANDKYGHAVGDEVIKNIVEIIRSNISPDALFARLGGDEFVIITHDRSRTHMKNCMELIRHKVEISQLMTDDKKLIKSCSISNGMAYYKEGMKNIDELLKEADLALYEAKGNGRNRVVFR